MAQTLPFFDVATQAAFDHYWQPNVDPFDPVDTVLAAYPPLANEPFYAIFGRPLMTCAESALLLALMKVWEDKESSKSEADRAPFPHMLATRAPNGLTRPEMIRRLMHLAIRDFPILEYRVGTDDYILISGSERTDNWAIVFVPADPLNNFPVAHWSFAQVTAAPPEEEQPAQPPWPSVVYSTLPIYALTVYWRAKVVPENIAEYHAAHAMGVACDCDWKICCDHEQTWLFQQVGGPQRITCEGSEHVIGTFRALVTHVLAGTYRRISDSQHKYTYPDGRVLVCTGMDPLASIKPNSKTYWMSNWKRNNPYLLQQNVGTFVFGSFVLQVKQFENESDLWTPSLPKARTLALFATTWGQETFQHVVELQLDYPKLQWASEVDLHMTLPRRRELLNRLALREVLTEASILDTVRKMAAEERWKIDVDRAEFQLWLKRTVTEVGKAMIPPVSSTQCWNCLSVSKTYRHMCKQCKQNQRMSILLELPMADETVTYVGFRPLWSKIFEPPLLELKPDVRILLQKDQTLLCSGAGFGRMTVVELFAYLKRRTPPRTIRGHLRGPMFLNMEPTCFSRGQETGVIAFMIRLGSKRVHKAEQWIYELGYQFILPFLSQIYPEDWDHFIQHFHGEKREKNELGRAEEMLGWMPPVEMGIRKVRMTGFTKAEKSYSYEYAFDFLKKKDTEKPRFICSPSPIVLARLGMWTHAQTKWLAAEFSYQKRMFYAGCATPEQLHQWLNITLQDCPDPYTLVDDITAIDANHNEQSFAWHKQIRQHQFPYISDEIEALFLGEETLRVRVGLYKCEVTHVNASGVSDTSYKNSMLCLVIRQIAILHGFTDITQLTTAQQIELLHRLRHSIWTAASGDDGITRLPDKVLGIPTTEFSICRYQEAWAWAGFSVKAAMVPPTRWRMATFLAMRPVWSATRYEWAPEPARRMRGMFWQIDNAMHPMAWARGIATQVLQQARALPVLSDICEWYLKRTSGPCAKLGLGQVTNEYSPFANSVMSAGKSARSIAEFLMDYRVTQADYDRFLSVLDSVSAPFVAFDCHILRRIYQEES